ncbi:hypothetical protein N9N67_10740 [Bacteriovoracaceae bacterium]|nr:hypothetical protein [Bacteriovoracaceae bacterium]
MNVPTNLLIRLCCLFILYAPSSFSQIDHSQLFYHYQDQGEGEDELKNSLKSYLYDKRHSLQANLTLGLIQLFGAEVQVHKYYLNNKLGYYVEVDWESFKSYRNEIYHQFGVSSGHYLLKYFFIGLKLQSRRNYPVPFYGIEGGVRVPFNKKLNRFSIGLKGTATRPFPMKNVEGLGISTFPEFQLTIGFRLSGYNPNSYWRKKNDQPTLLDPPNFFY